MKKKIALVLAAAMTISMLPMNAFAASSNSLSRTGTTVREDEKVLNNNLPVTLDIKPTSEVLSNESIILTVANGKFDESLMSVEPYIYATEKKEGLETKYAEYFFDAYEQAGGMTTALEADLTKFIKTRGSSELPYMFRYINEEQIEVKLFPIDSGNVNTTSGDYTKNAAIYSIALPIVAEDSDDGAITVSIDSNGSSISSGTYTVATVVSGDGSTTASVVASNIDVTSDEAFAIPDITIKEDISGTFDGQTIKVKLNGNYEWIKTPEIKAGVNCLTDKVATDVKIDGRTLEFTLVDGAFDENKLASIIISCNKDKTGEIKAVNAKDDDTYGDVNVTISGNKGITTETIKVGERADYGFELKALEEPTTIFAGRTPFADGADEEDFVTAEFQFGETTPGTWLTGRKLEFSVPEGVKIVGYDITDTDGMDVIGEAKIVNDGTTLRFDANTGNVKADKASTLDMKLYLSTSIEFSGDVTLAVAGAGLEADTLTDLVIAKVVTPVTVEAATTKSNIGYKSVETSDIKITENAVGALRDGKTVEITLDDTYGSDLAFDDANTEITVDGELEVKSFKVKNKAISFQIDAESYANPSTITISGVAVGTTRSIPYGSYSILVGGDAIVENYVEDVDQKSTIVISEGDLATPSDDADTKDYDKFEEEGFEFADYLEIVTETLTLDGEVRVTIGERALVMDGQTVEMDAAAYIQTASNSTMVPLRFVTLALGVDQEAVTDADNSSKIAWDANTKTATIIYSAGTNQKIIQFTAGSNTMIVDGVRISMENGVCAEIVDSRMYVPFRALGQALGVPVTWDAETKTAIYNEK